MNLTEVCKDQSERRQRVRELAQQAESNEPNGIDYVEVEDGQLVITVYFLNKAPREIRPENIKITGGVRIRDIRVESIRLCELENPERDDCMRVKVNKYGDFSTYTLKLVNAPAGSAGETPLSGFDPRYAQIDFTFKANCPSDLDCLPKAQCYEPSLPEPEIDYLSKDYASFRQLILDRLSLIMPEWKETHVPDFGIAMVELLAYVGDYLSYYQDAVATEAYLGTARERISIRRHALLVDYQMHEGCNARAWVCVTPDRDAVLRDPKNVYFITGQNASYGKGGRMLMVRELDTVPAAGYEVFEPLLANGQNDPIQLYEAHKCVHFYTWHHEECCLPAGTTAATLKDSWAAIESPPNPEKPPEQQTDYGRGGKKDARDTEDESGEETDAEQEKSKSYSAGEPPQLPRKRVLHLRPGDVLIFEELLGPETGIDADADKSHRHAVRLTKVEEGVDPLYDQPILFIEWAREDALPFTLCVSTVGPVPECKLLTDVSVARGNVILVDHGATQTPEPFRAPDAIELSAGCWAAFEPRETILKSRAFPVTLKSGQVTYQSPYPAKPDLARAQLDLLAGFMNNVRRYVEGLWQQVKDGHALSKDSIAGLEIIFGRKALTAVGLIPATSKPKKKHPPDPAHQLRALSKLLRRFDELLAAKTRRLQVLRGRVLSGYILTAADETEIREMFGETLAGESGLWTTQMAGPAARALSQQPRECLPCIDLRDLVDVYSPIEGTIVSIVTVDADVRSGSTLARIRVAGAATDASGTNATTGGGRRPRVEELRSELDGEIVSVIFKPGDLVKAGEKIISLKASGDRRWYARNNLLASGSSDRHFVAEIDNEGRAHLRFGDGELGRAPEPGGTLTATYRVGNGVRGNVGAETISHIVFRQTESIGASLTVRNPLPAQGGVEPESIEEVRMFAPGAFRKELQRAITADDYARLAERNRLSQVQRAAADLRWTGSWYEVRTGIDPLGVEGTQPQLQEDILNSLYRYRRISHDLAVDVARYVPLRIALHVCVQPHYLRGHVKAALEDVFSNRTLPGGKRGFFHPDNLTFGDGIYLSALVAAAQSVEGVESVQVTQLERLFEGSKGELASGFLPLSPREVARVDNDPSFPENGLFTLDVGGGR